jgi:fructokinase
MSLKSEGALSDEMIWELEAGYIAYGLATLTYVLSPQRIIIGGGVMNQTSLLERIRDKTMPLLNNYAVSEEITKNTESYIVSPALSDKSGVLGAILMARSL